MTDVSKETKIAILESEIRAQKEQQYVLTIRGKVAANLGNQKVLDNIQDASEKTVKTLALLNEELEKVRAGQ